MVCGLVVVKITAISKMIIVVVRLDLLGLRVQMVKMETVPIKSL